MFKAKLREQGAKTPTVTFDVDVDACTEHYNLYLILTASGMGPEGYRIARKLSPKRKRGTAKKFHDYVMTSFRCFL